MALKLKPVLLSGIAFGAFSVVAGAILGVLWEFIVPGYSSLYPAQVFRAFNDPLMQVFFLVPFIEGVIFAYFYESVNKVISCNTPFERGTTYGLFFLIGTVSGLLMTFTSFNVSAMLVVVWVLQGLIILYFGGGILAMVYEKLDSTVH